MIKAFETKSSTLFHLAFASNTILSCFFFFLLIIDFYFLISAVIMQVFVVAAELAMPTGIPGRNGKVEI